MAGGIVLTSGFDRNVPVPLDLSFVAADNTARDAIASGIRYEGMLVYVTSTKKMWQLQGGITNSDWKEAGGGSGSGVVTVADKTARDAIPSGDRKEGMLVYLSDTRSTFQLQGGIANTDWVNFRGDQVLGTFALPKQITSLGLSSTNGTMFPEYHNQTIFICGSVANQTRVLTTNQIELALEFGAKLKLIGCDSTRPVQIDDGSSVSLPQTRTLYQNSILNLWFNGTVWMEESWRE